MNLRETFKKVKKVSELTHSSIFARQPSKEHNVARLRNVKKREIK